MRFLFFEKKRGETSGRLQIYLPRGHQGDFATFVKQRVNTAKKRRKPFKNSDATKEDKEVLIETLWATFAVKKLTTPKDATKEMIGTIKTPKVTFVVQCDHR